MILKHVPSVRFLAISAPFLFANSLFAQDEAAQEKPGFLEDVVANAGLIGGLIVLMSVVALALIIENFMSIKREKVAPPDLEGEVEALFEAQDWDTCDEVCLDNPCYYANVVRQGLRKGGHDFETLQKAVREQQTEESVKLFQKIGWLSLISAIAPMMGLFGTVTGMFTTFGTIAASGGNVSPAKLAGGIKGALVTTMLGLSVAIPVGIAFFVMRNRVIRTSSEVNAMTEELFEVFRSK